MFAKEAVKGSAFPNVSATSGVKSAVKTSVKSSNSEKASSKSGSFNEYLQSRIEKQPALKPANGSTNGSEESLKAEIAYSQSYSHETSEAVNGDEAIQTFVRELKSQKQFANEVGTEEDAIIAATKGDKITATNDEIAVNIANEKTANVFGEIELAEEISGENNSVKLNEADLALTEGNAVKSGEAQILNAVNANVNANENSESLATFENEEVSAKTDLSANNGAREIVNSESSKSAETSGNPAKNSAGLGEDELARTFADLNPTEAKVSTSSIQNNGAVSNNSQNLASSEVSVNAEELDNSALKTLTEAYLRPAIKESGELKEILGEKQAQAPEEADKFGKPNAFNKSLNSNLENEQNSNGLNASNASAKAVETTVIKEEFGVMRQTNEAIIEKISALKEQFNNSGKAETTFEITLNPENLGKLTVKLHATALSVTVQIIADDPKTREYLASRAQIVSTALSANGFTVEKYEVITAAQSSQSQRDLAEEQGEKQNQTDETAENASDEEEIEVSFAEIVEAMI